MPLPGYEVDLTDAPPSLSEFTDTGTSFWLGKSDTAAFGLIHSIDQFRLSWGDRDPASVTYDSVEEFFREGGSRLYLATAATDAEDADIVALLDSFKKELGPGQLAAPGITTVAVQKALMAATLKSDRVALLDATDTETAATIVTQAEALTGSDGDRFSALFAPWDEIPGVTLGGTTRVVPPSARVCGIIGRNDFDGVPRNQPSAGPYGISRRLIGLSQDPWTDDDRQDLNDAGVNVTLPILGGYRLYGYRSLADQATDRDWSMFSNSRCIMAIKNALSIMCENFVFSMLDGQLVAVKKFAGAIAGVLNPYWLDGELYGATPGQAYSIDVGPAQNTVNTFANGELHAKVGLRTSAFAERVYIDVSKVPITESLAA